MTPFLSFVNSDTDTEDLIPADNIAFVEDYHGITRIWLRQVAGVDKPGALCYRRTKETPTQINNRLLELRELLSM